MKGSVCEYQNKRKQRTGFQGQAKVCYTLSQKKICGTNLFYGSTDYDPEYDPILQHYKSLDYNNSVCTYFWINLNSKKKLQHVCAYRRSEKF